MNLNQQMKKKKLNNIVSCGFNKWSIGFYKNGQVAVEIGEHPIYATIELYDATIEEFRKLGEMFLSEAIRLENLQKKRETNKLKGSK